MLWSRLWSDEATTGNEEISRGVSWIASLWEGWLDTAPQRETAAILLRGPVLLACTLNAEDTGTNYGGLAYGQQGAASSNDGSCQLLCQCRSDDTIFTAKKQKKKKKAPPNYYHLPSWWWSRMDQGRRRRLGGVGIIHLQPGRGAGALKHPAGREGLGMQPAVSAPAQRLPWG